VPLFRIVSGAISSELALPLPFFIINALVVRRTVLHDMSVLAIRRIMQINSRPTEIIIYF